MQDDVKTAARGVLTKYLETSRSRKTPERFAILDAVYSQESCFTLADVVAWLGVQNFQVSRATLYNTMRLLIELRLVIRHRFQTGTKYEACYASESHCHQICTVCGRVTDIDVPDVAEALRGVKLRRFRKECFALYVYGICAACQSRISRNKAAKKK